MGQGPSQKDNPAATPLVELTQANGGPSHHESFKYWRSVEPDTPEDLKIIEHFDHRGSLKIAGAAYHEPRDIEQFDKASYVGLSYQISSLTNIDSVSETFKAVVDLNLMYRIHDEDKEKYEEYRSKGSITFQDIADKPDIKTKPPVWEIRNAATSPEWLHERIAAIMQCYDHRKGEWGWYVQLYAQFRVDCYEEFEMQRFPFTRNSLQIQLQAKNGSFGQTVLVPFNARSAMPHWMLTFNQNKEKEVKEMRIRGNTYKCDKTTGNWEVEQHHVAFIPNAVSPPMPSGNKFPIAVITIQCKQNWSFYIWNTVPVVFFLPLLTASAVLESYCELADRMSIVLALLLTMATYKVSISSWIPQKDYLTFMDRYIIVGFMFIMVQGTFVVVTSVVLKYMSEEGRECGEENADVGDPTWNDRPITKKAEEIVVVIMSVVWFASHLYVLTRLGTFYKPWTTILAEENKGLKAIQDNVTKERNLICQVKFKTGIMPPPPADQMQTEY